jgi:hypothetical protein
MVRLNRSPEMGKLAEGKALYYQRRATPDERCSAPKPDVLQRGAIPYALLFI